jgi:nucleoside 2-deoxyribosyltransferase
MKQKLKIYFAGSIRGGRDDRKKYLKIIKYLQKYGEVLTEHIGDKKITDKGDVGLTEEEIYERDINWLNSADVVIAEVSNPSFGVGYEIAKAESLDKKVLCLYQIKKDKFLSAMITGSFDVEVRRYSKLSGALMNIDKFFKREF